jgi:cytochrome c5
LFPLQPSQASLCSLYYPPLKLGDKAEWAIRNKKGMDTLVKNAIDGFKGAKGMMPPKGGNPKLTDGDVKAAVKYMLDSAK